MLNTKFLKWLLPAILFVFNAWLIRELFSLEYGLYMSSIESTYMALGRHIIEKWPDLAWFRYWYAGLPFENAYPPLLSFLVAGWAVIRSCSPALAYHQLIAVAYCLAPVTLYLLATHLGTNRFVAFIASGFYSLVSPSALLVREIQIDLGTPWRPRRFQILFSYGEGPHETSLMLLPLAVIAFDRAIQRPTLARIGIAAILAAAVASTNWLGAFSLTMALLCLFFVRGFSRVSLLTAALAGVVAYCSVCAWLPPSLVGVIRTNSSRLATGYSAVGTLLPLFVCVVLLLFGLRRMHRALRLSSSTLFFVSTVIIFVPVVLGMFWYRVEFLPQPTRYQLEMDFALVFAVTLVIGQIAERFGRIALAVVGALAILPVWHQIAASREWISAATRPIDVKQTLEYQLAGWFKERKPEGRVYLSGSTSFWLNVWADTEQLEGDFNNGIVNWNAVYAEDAAMKGSAEATLAWMKALGVRHIEMTGGRGRNAFSFIKDPGKLAGLLPVERREPGNVIYALPMPVAGLAHRVSRSDLVTVPPKHYLDLAQVRQYVAALEREQPAGISFRWLNEHAFELATQADVRGVVSVQETWAPGWRATVDGRSQKLERDGLGFMVVEPECSAPCRIRFEYKRPLAPVVITILGWLAIVAFLTFGRRVQLFRASF